MDKRKLNKIKKIVQDLGWNMVVYDDRTVEFQAFSPLGEDFVFYVDKNSLIEDVKDYYLNFDPEEHAVDWYNNRNSVNGVPDSIRALLSDADEIDKMLEKLSDSLLQI